MSTMLLGHMTTTLPRSTTTEPLVWSNPAGPYVFGTQSGGTHDTERIWTPSLNTYRSFSAPTTYCMAGVEGRNMIGATGNDTYIFEVETASSQPVASLRVNPAGNLKVFNGTTLIATSATPITTQASFYTIEFGWGNTAGTVSYETRVAGVRIPELTSTDFPAAGGQQVGTGARPAPAGAGGAGAVCSRVVLNDSSSIASIVVYWFWQKNGTSMWTPVSTGSTFALSSDWTGPKKRAWCSPNAVGNYTIPGAGSGTQTSNWANGAGTYPSSIADTSGMDSDTTYIRNQVDGTTVAADKISHAYTDLPGTATTVGFVQRTVLGRLDSASVGAVRTGRRVAGADTADTTTSFDSTYTSGTSPALGLSKFYPCQPDGTTIYTPALVNAFEGIIELVDVG